MYPEKMQCWCQGEVVTELCEKTGLSEWNERGQADGESSRGQSPVHPWTSRPAVDDGSTAEAELPEAGIELGAGDAEGCCGLGLVAPGVLQGRQDGLSFHVG